MIFPATISHLFYIGFMVASLVFEFVTGIFFAEGLGNFWIIVYLAMDIVRRWLDWKSIVKLISTTHVILTDNNVYYWMLNYFTFGILGTWPLVRPDFFQRIEDLYCAYWSCWFRKWYWLFQKLYNCKVYLMKWKCSFMYTCFLLILFSFLILSHASILLSSHISYFIDMIWFVYDKRKYAIKSR